MLRCWYGVGGDFRAAEIGATVWVVFGFWQLALGVRSALTHDDPFSVTAFSISVAALLFVVNYWGDAPRMLGVNAALLHAFFLALLADCVVNFWLQLRGFLPRRVPPVAGAARVGMGLRVIMQAHNARLALVAAERDRAIAERDNIARSLEVQHEAAGLLTLPDVGKFVLAALHPDRAKTEADKRLATQRFQAASAVLEKIGVRR